MRFHRLIALVTIAVLLSGCGGISIIRPEGPNAPTVSSPVTFVVQWRDARNLRFLLDGQDRTAEFAPSGSPVTRTIEVPAGLHTLEVWGDVDCFYCAGGVNYQGTVQQFTVTAPVAPDFTLSVPASVTVQRGRSATFSVTVNRNAQMLDPVNVAVSGPPPGITVAYQPNPVAQNQQNSVATVSAASNLGIGPVSLSITAQGGGISRTASTNLQVAYADRNLPQSGIDCDCASIGDWVDPIPLQSGSTSPDGSFTLTTSVSGGRVTLLLNRANPVCAMAFGSYDLSHPIQWGFSPNGKYFVVARYQQSAAYADFYGLVACNTPSSTFATPAHQAPAEGDFAGWGFAPDRDDARFVMAGMNAQQRPEVSLVNVPANFQQLVASPNTEAAWTFSPCGDLFSIKRAESSPQARLVFESFHTRNAAFVAPAGLSTVDIAATYSDASLNANSQCHRLRRVRLSDGMTEPEPQWPCMLNNEADATCQ